MKSIAMILAGVLAVSASGCVTNSGLSGFQRPVVSGGSLGNTPSTFLRTNYAPLDQWLGERFDVTYRNMKLGGRAQENIFAQEPIEEVHYRFVDVGRSGSLFHLKAKRVSRREILYKIALHYNLRMSIENVNGKPAFVRVEGRDPGSRFNPGMVAPDLGAAVREF